MHDEVHCPQGTQSSSAGGICPGMKSMGTQAGRGLKDCRQLKSTPVLVAAVVAAPASVSGTASPHDIKIVSLYCRNLASSLCCAASVVTLAQFLGKHAHMSWWLARCIPLAISCLQTDRCTDRTTEYHDVGLPADLQT